MEIAQNKNYVKNLSKNFIFSLIFEVLNIFFTFFVRFFFVRQLGNSYLSINGLFQNVIGVISFADLGIGTVMTFFLYENIIKNETEKINILLKFYKKIYLVISIVIAILGICAMPLMPFMISDDVVISENIYLVFGLFIANTSASYLFCSSKTLLIANQKSYYVNIITHGFHIVLSTIQVVLLAFLKNYYLYLGLQTFFTLAINLCIHIYASKKYPFINQRVFKSLPADAKKRFGAETKNILIYRLGATLVNSTDNIIISIVVASSFVGLASNYFLMVNSVNTVLMAVCNSFVGTIGIICASEKNTKNKFDEINLISNSLFMFSAICLFSLSTPFVSLVFGEEYILDTPVVFSMVLPFLLTGMNQIVSLFRTSFGIFKEGKYIPLVCGLLNVILSILLGHFFGLIGIFIATSISKLLTFSIFDPLLLFKKRIGIQYLKNYYLKYVYEIVFEVILMLFIHELIATISISNKIFEFVVSSVLCVVFSSAGVLFTLSFFRESRYLAERTINVLRRFKQKQPQ